MLQIPFNHMKTMRFGLHKAGDYTHLKLRFKTDVVEKMLASPAMGKHLPAVTRFDFRNGYSIICAVVKQDFLYDFEIVKRVVIGEKTVKKGMEMLKTTGVQLDLF